MNLSKNIDIYCERLDFSFWAEPLNAITNLSFALAGLWGLYLYKQNASRWTKIFGILAIIVGIGSFLFHTFGTGCGLEIDKWIQPGDTIELFIEKIGTLTNKIGTKQVKND